ncbi:MAG: hypothetical protein GC160_24230 [Acidobacteria bacterium]|nr:hypothetical protein [Acidobacteriota bacterium]
MAASLLRVWIVAMLLAAVTAHPGVRRTAAWGLSFILPFELAVPWHPSERERQPASAPVRHGLACLPQCAKPWYSASRSGEPS